MVALADVYDALTSERCYKHAYDHDTALRMILNGECGAFNPLLLDCLRESSEQLRTELTRSEWDRGFRQETHRLSEEILHREALPGRTTPSCCWSRKRNARISTPPSAAASGSTTTCWLAA